MDCIFCKILNQEEKIIFENKELFAIFDRFPVSPGHTLIMPKRHVKSVFELNKEEFTALEDALKKVKRIIEKEHEPVAYNIGINNGPKAGQAIFHAHFHVIPRYENQQRGGMRKILNDYL